MSPHSDLNTLFKASSIAIVGISSDPQKIGSVMYKNLKVGGYAGKIFFINPKYETLYELPCYPNLAAVTEEIDCACIAIPAKHVKQVITDAATKKVRNVVVITAGFGEKGSNGKELEHELADLANGAGITILGPNCLGFMNLHDHINLSFAATAPEIGDIGLISQSGAICTAILDLAEKDNLGFSYAISIGNKANLTENDIVSYLLNDERTKVMGAYLEDLRNGRKLLELYNDSHNAKPLIIIKPGVSDAGKKAIGSHTGAVTGSAMTIRTALAQSGIIQADSLDEFYSLLQCFSLCKPLKGPNIAILTNAGGPGILATDSLIASHLSLAPLTEITKERLQAALPSEASVQNPIDILGDAKADRFKHALEVLSEDEMVDGILVIITPQYVTQIKETAEVLAQISKTSSKTIIPILLGNYMVEEGKQILRANNCTYATEIQTAVTTLAKMNFYQYQKSLIAEHPRIKYDIPFAQNSNSTTKLLDTQAANDLAATYNIPLPEQLVTDDKQVALHWAKARYPVVIKVPTKVAAHKTEVKGVIVNIKTDKEFSNAWDELQDAFLGSSALHIQKHLPSEEEFFIGATKDESLGYLMVFGKGGIYTQEYLDYGNILLPASRRDIIEELARTKISRILVGARGKPPMPVDQIVHMIENFQKMLLEHPEIVSLDVNPVIVGKKEVTAVDIKCYLVA